MKLQTIILLGCLIFFQTITLPIYAIRQSEEISMQAVQNMRKHNVKLSCKREHERRRSALSVVLGYVEDDVLYLSFNLPLSNAHIRVVDGETGKTVFDGVVSGTSCSITLERDSESFEIYF